MGRVEPNPLAYFEAHYFLLMVGRKKPGKRQDLLASFFNGAL